MAVPGWMQKPKLIELLGNQEKLEGCKNNYVFVNTDEEMCEDGYERTLV